VVTICDLSEPLDGPGFSMTAMAGLVEEQDGRCWRVKPFFWYHSAPGVDRRVWIAELEDYD
jgi:hypothetical protein